MIRLRGFSLVEMLIVVTLIGIIAISSQSLNSDTLDRWRANTTIAAMNKAVANARRIAFRNAGNLEQTQTAAIICLNGNFATIHEATPSTEATCDSDIVWQIKLTDVALFENQSMSQSSVLTCAAFSNHGLLLRDANCTDDEKYFISSGDYHASSFLL